MQQHLLLYFGLVLLHFYTGSYYPGNGRWLCRDPWRWSHGGKLSSQCTCQTPHHPEKRTDFSFCCLQGLESSPGSPTCSCSSQPLKPDPIQQLHKSLGTGLPWGVEQLAAHGRVSPFSPACLHLLLK